METVPLVTVPPPETAKVPVPELPMVRVEEPASQFAPVTFTVPVAPLTVPRVAAPLVTSPPSAMVSVPVPEAPTYKVPLRSQDESVPVTVIVPLEPLFAPMVPCVPPLIVPPLSTVSVPLPHRPTMRSAASQVEPAPVTVTVPRLPA